MNSRFGSATGANVPLSVALISTAARLAAVARAARPVAGVLVRHDLEVVLRLAAIGHRPEQRVGVVRLDVLVDRDDPLAGEAVQRRRAVERAPDFGLRRAARELDRDHARRGW